MRRALAVLGCSVSLALAACGGATDDAEGPDPADRTDQPATTDGTEPATDDPTSAAESELLDFEADDVRGGDRIDAGEYAGSDVVLWFWAPW